MMKRFTALAMLAIWLALPGCATILSDELYEVPVISDSQNPAYQSASVVIKDRSGKVVWTGVTPSRVKLHASDGAFRANDHTVECTYQDGKKSMFHVRSNYDEVVVGNAVAFVIFLPLGLASVVTDAGTGYIWEVDDRPARCLPEFAK